MNRLYLVFLLLFSSTTATAMDLTLLYGSQGGGDIEHIDTDSTLSLRQQPVYGFILGSPTTTTQDLEFYYSRQQTEFREGEAPVPAEDLLELDIHYFHIGGTVLTEEYDDMRGFLSGGMGLTHFSPSLQGADAESRFSMSLGLGARWMPTKRVGVRVEGRLFGSLFDSNTTIFCSGGCQFTISGDLLTQSTLFAGVVVHFD